MKKILLIGSNSFVGKNLVSSLKELENYELIGAFHKNKNPKLENQEKIDITSKKDVLRVLKKIKPDIIIILSAVSSSKEPKDKIIKLNVDGVENIISSLNDFGLNSKVILFSSDQIFDGNKGLYSEKDIPNPINEYGKSKLMAESIIKKNEDYIILRCSLILGNKSNDDHENFVTNFIKSKEKLTIFSDVYRTPIYVNDIGRIIKKLIETDYNGILNVGGDEYLSFLEMAERIEKEYNLKKDYNVLQSKEKTIPKKLGLNNHLLLSLIDFRLTTFEEMLADMKSMKKQTGET